MRLQLVFAGILTLGGAVIGLYFLRFWHRARDGLFLYFCVGFWLLALNWLLGAFVRADESQSWHYVVRLAAFGVILVGIWRKNQRAGAP
ncbi:MAG: DUF5985 family protein [Phycisphaerales bacterium]